MEGGYLSGFITSERHTAQDVESFKEAAMKPPGRSRLFGLLMVVLLATALLVLVGCAGGETTTTTGATTTEPPPSSTSTTVAEGPVTIVASRTNDPHSLDPADEITIGGGLESQVALYERLINISDASGELEPALAERWEISDDGLTYTFYLRKGVKFHDGTAFNAEAVRFTWQRIMGIGTGASQYWELVQDIEVIDDYTCAMKLSEPSPPFLATLAGQRGIYMGPSPTLVKASEKTPGDWAVDYFVDHECGTGPYTLVSWSHDQELVYERFDDYWRGWEGPHVDRIIHRVVKEPATARLLLENGEIDIAADDLPIEMVADMKGKGHIVLDVAPSTALVHFTFNMDKAPTSDKRVRQAIAMLFDYDAAIDGAFRGYAKRLYGPIPSSVWPAIPAEAKRYERDVEAAKALLAEAGYANGFTIRMASMDILNYKTLVQILQQNLAEVSITVNADFTTWPVLFEQLQQPKGEKPFDMASYQMWAAIPDPIDILMWWHTRAITVINPGWGTPETDEMLDEAAVALDHAERERLYGQVIIQMCEDCPAVNVAEVEHVTVRNDWLKGFEYIPYYNGLVNWYDLYVEGRPEK